MEREQIVKNINDKNNDIYTLIELYNSEKQEEKNKIYSKICSFSKKYSNVDRQGCYEKNCDFLQSYPFVFGWNAKSWDQLEGEIFWIDGEKFYVHHKAKRQFYGAYSNTKKDIPYCFKNLDNPLLLEKVFTHSYLQFLQDNVRKSEDYGDDNHIYLAYDNEDWFSILLQCCDLRPYLQDKKFVFLVGDNAKEQYPINFKEQFGIEYREENRKPIQIEEIKRICYWYKMYSSGTNFGTGVLGESSYMQYRHGATFHSYATIYGEELWYKEVFRNLLKNPKTLLTFAQLKSYTKENGYDLHFEEYSQFILWLEKRVKKSAVTIVDLFKGYFLFFYEQKEKNPRIAPMILWDLHMLESNLYEEIVKEFPYQVVVTSMRNPIMTLARAYDYGLIGHDRFQTQYMVASTYVHTQFLSEEFDEIYYGYCFENLKKYPRQQLYSLCRLLNIPMEDVMFESKVSMTSNSGEVTQGFEQSALLRNTEKELSTFDQMRLKIYYEPILKYYEYDSFDSEEYPLSEEEIYQLFKYPFRFERLNKEKFGRNAPKDEELRRWIEEIMVQTYHGYRQGVKIRFPKLVEPDWEVE